MGRAPGSGFFFVLPSGLQDTGALDVFISTLTGDPGRQPKELVDDVPTGDVFRLVTAERDCGLHMLHLI